ncbi:hypothetical protein Hanom_Chr12g01085121 [Helianthus anomalus]
MYSKASRFGFYNKPTEILNRHELALTSSRHTRVTRQPILHENILCFLKFSLRDTSITNQIFFLHLKPKPESKLRFLLSTKPIKCRRIRPA